jgi:glutathione S-transferase
VQNASSKMIGIGTPSASKTIERMTASPPRQTHFVVVAGVLTRWAKLAFHPGIDPRPESPANTPMPLTIHGSPRSRTMRVLWMAAELDLDYEHDPIAFDDPALKSAEFLRLNPAGAIPTIEEDGFALAESLAINLYLAKKHSLGGLYPATLEGEAQAWRWSLWAQGQLEPWIMRDALLADLRAAIAPHAVPAIASALTTLERALSDRQWLVGEGFTVADLNMAAVLSPSRSGRLDLAPYPSVAAWLARCYARPAALATRARFG